MLTVFFVIDQLVEILTKTASLHSNDQMPENGILILVESSFFILLL